MLKAEIAEQQLAQNGTASTEAATAEAASPTEAHSVATEQIGHLASV
jgi:hypothetical protein